MGKKGKKKNVKKLEASDVWTEEEYEEYLKAEYGMEFIAGFTEGGMPYGTFIGETLIDNDMRFEGNPFDDREDAHGKRRDLRDGVEPRDDVMEFEDGEGLDFGDGHAGSGGPYDLDEGFNFDDNEDDDIPF